jgi:hypothetical protein
MKIFVFERINKVSDNYHTEIGLVIIAGNIEHAKDVIKQDTSIEVSEDEWQHVECFELANNEESKFWVMPDAGCC